jgi:hypothetical protein
MGTFTAGDVEGAHVSDFAEDDGRTLDAYGMDTRPNHTIRYHYEWLTSIVAICTNSGAYIVKKRISGKTVWNVIDRNGLDKLLEKIADIVSSGRMKQMKGFQSLDTPVINNALRRYYNVEFHSLDTAHVFNLWRKHEFEVFLDDVAINMDLLKPWFEHLENVICNHNPDYYRLLLLKDAWMFQHPNEHLEWATVLMGAQRAGKNRYTDLLCDLWGKNWTQPNVTDMSVITDDKHRKTVFFTP